MDGWFTRKQAKVDAVVALGAAAFASAWFAQVLGAAGCLGLFLAAFGATQLVRFVNAQRATLEWAKMQEAGLPEKLAPAVATRGDGYRDAAVVDEPPSPEAVHDEAEIGRRRTRARRSLGIVGALLGIAALVPGFAFGAWAVPVGLGLLAGFFVLFFLMMLGMQRYQRRVASDAVSRQRVALELPKVRVGVDFGVPPAEIIEREEAEQPERADERRAR